MATLMSRLDNTHNQPGTSARALLVLAWVCKADLCNMHTSSCAAVVDSQGRKHTAEGNHSSQLLLNSCPQLPRACCAAQGAPTCC